MVKLAFATALVAGTLTITAAEAGGYGYGCGNPCGARQAMAVEPVIFQPIVTAPTYYFQPMSCDNCYVVPRGNVYRPHHWKKRRAYRRY